MEISELNNLASDLMVARLTVDNLKDELEAEILKNPTIRDLEVQIETAKAERVAVQNTMLEAMTLTELKTWKTEQCTVSRTKKETVRLKDGIKDELKRRMKEGETFDLVELNEAEFISIRVPKQ